jgi:2-keto-4-pentenoate hydratase
VTTDRAVEDAAERILTAATTGMPCLPVRDLIGSDDLARAYAVQRAVVRSRLDGGAVVVGRKIGLTSKAVQQQLGVDQPDLGVLFADTAYADGDTVPFHKLMQPRVEAEVAFVLRNDLPDENIEREQAVDAVEYAVAALEIADSRIADWDITFGDTVADNASAGAFVLGRERVPLRSLVPKAVEMTMTVTGQPESTGTGAACLGDPLVALHWLAQRAARLGDPLRAGDVVLSGALGPMRPVLPGTTATTHITGLGTVTVHIGEE